MNLVREIRFFALFAVGLLLGALLGVSNHPLLAWWLDQPLTVHLVVVALLTAIAVWPFPGYRYEYYLKLERVGDD